MIGLIPVNDGDVLKAVQDFLKSLLESGTVDAVYTPMRTGDGVVMPALVSDPARLGEANPLAPVMPINGARAVSALTGKHAPARMAVVLRSCEVRALYELVKLQQATLEDVTIISLDCPGTYEIAEYSQRGKEIGEKLGEYLDAAKEGRQPALDGLSLRTACQMCVYPLPEHADIALHLFGVEASQGIPVELEGELAARLAISPAPDQVERERQAVIEPMIAGHSDVRKAQLSAIRERLAGDGGIAALFNYCIRCHNCMTACPICYCKTCLFKTASFDHQPEHYLTAARQKGAMRMMGDTLLFQLTRLNHMSASCVSCGMCTSACPADIPVGVIFSAIGEQVDAAFEYVPGRDLSESLPLITFQANEWLEVGEAR
jgi:formate dehydrogenase (coenzyme F420) beta subunit